MLDIQNEFVEQFRARAHRIEQEGGLPADLLEWMYEEKLFKLFVPEELGGRLMPLPDAFRLFEQVSRIDGNAGWLVTIGSGGGAFVPAMTEEAAQAVYRGRTAVIAGSGMPTGKAVPVEGGYRISGRWGYCSGAPYATTFTATCRIDRGEANEGAEELLSFAFRPEQVEIVEDWASFGLKATGSHSITVTDAFVPEAMAFVVGTYREADPHPVYRYPFLPFAQGSFAAVGIGIARHFLDEAELLVSQRRTLWEAAKPGRAERTLSVIGEQRERLTEAAGAYYAAVERSWEQVAQGGVLADDEQQAVIAACKAAASTSVAAAQAVFPKLGMAALMEPSALNRTYRDLHTACQHSLLTG